MQTITELSASIVKLCSEKHLDEIDKIKWGKDYIYHYLDDVFKVIKNIEETSLDSGDRFRRIAELEEKYGIPKTHLI